MKMPDVIQSHGFNSAVTPASMNDLPSSRPRISTPRPLLGFSAVDRIQENDNYLGSDFFAFIGQLLNALAKVLNLVRDIEALAGKEGKSEDHESVDRFVALADTLRDKIRDCDNREVLEQLLQKLDSESLTVPKNKRVLLSLAQISGEARNSMLRITKAEEARVRDRAAAVEDRHRKEVAQLRDKLDAAHAADTTRMRLQLQERLNGAQKSADADMKALRSELRKYEIQAENETASLQHAEQGVAAARRAAEADGINRNRTMPSATSRTRTVSTASRPAPTSKAKAFDKPEAAQIAAFLGVVALALPELLASDGSGVHAILSRNDRDGVLLEMFVKELAFCEHVLREELKREFSFEVFAARLLDA